MSCAMKGTAILRLLIWCSLMLNCIKAVVFKAGKVNITTHGPGLFACKTTTFPEPFTGGKEVKVFASFAHSVKRPTRGNGGSIWVESEDNNQFTTCISEYGEGSDGSAEVNWIAVQSVPLGAERGTTALDSWTTGTECKRINFQKRFVSAPAILVTPSHQIPERPQDALAVWIQHSSVDSFRLCLREAKIFAGLHRNIKINWLAFTSLNVDNVTLTNSLVFTNWTSQSQQRNNAVCQKFNFTDPFYPAPVVVVTPKCSYGNESLQVAAEPGCDEPVTAWVEYTSTKETEICVRKYNRKIRKNASIKVDYVVIGALDACINVTCDYHCQCKPLGPNFARCVSIDFCPTYQDPICSSNGTTFDNKCFFEQEMCQLQLNFTMYHSGSCEGFPFQRGRRHMPHIPSLGYSHCEIIPFQPDVFYPDKSIEVQITVNHMDTTDMSYVHDAAVCWVENVNYHEFSACVMAAGFNERRSVANVTVDWLAYQGAPVGGISGEKRISQWWTGTTCETVNFPSGKFFRYPSIFVTAAHHHAGLKRDAASLWLEDVSDSSFKICLRELQNYAGSHEDIYAKWLAFSSLEKPLFSEHDSVYFANTKHPPADFNNAFCKDVHFTKLYQKAPSVFVSANHSSSGNNRDPVRNSITAWVEYINTTGARVCLKELYEKKYDPLSISFTIMSDICQPGWSYFDGFCYFTSSVCSSWLTAASNCTTMNSSLVTIHNHEENVYIQHRHHGERSWIGLNDRSVEGSFVWTNTELSRFRFWAPKQPNNFKNEDCVHTLGAKHDYKWNDVPCEKCYNFTCFKDLDECSINAYYCGGDTTCQNTVGSWKCSCKNGYTGEVKACTDVDECARNSHSCDSNAACRNTPGSYICRCNAGYSGDGRTCTDIDECASGLDRCHSSRATCTNTVGSYRCSCNLPYTGDGRTCNFVSECQNYRTLISSDRKVTYPRIHYHCDNRISTAWYRFQGNAGNRMPSSCPPVNRCNTYAVAWLSGGHPSVSVGAAYKTVCFVGHGRCCNWSKSIRVRNCGSFYVYYLSGTPACNLRYCGTD